jgi:hypothetical protein
MSSSERIGAALQRSLRHLAPDARDEVMKCLSPEALEVMAAVIAIWVGAHFIGVGEAVDIILCVVGVFSLGMSVFEGIEHVWKFAQESYNADDEDDLEDAAQHFAKAVAILWIQAVLAVLFKNRPRSSRGGPRNVGTAPSQPGSALVAKPRLLPTRTMLAGEGGTYEWGDILISRFGTPDDRRLAAVHESVHRFLVPRLKILRAFRVRNRVQSYDRSALSKYLEEALAETIAQVSVNGFRATFRGVVFPVKERYVTLLKVDGQRLPFLPEVGGLVVGGFLVHGMKFQIWSTARPPRDASASP